MSEKKVFSIDITDENCGERLDSYLSSHLNEQSRSKIADLIKEGFITVSGLKKKPGYRIRPGDFIQGSIPFDKPHSAEPENIDLNILYDDDFIVVINKPPGLVVHPAPGNYSGTLVNALLYHYPELKMEDNDLRPGIVHRLDKDTSGVMVVAKTPSVQSILSEAFKERNVSKTYIALVHGKTLEEGVINEGIGRHPSERKKMSVFGKKKRNALTKWKTVETFKHASMIECSIETGRTHQIRVHCAFINHHILGDQTYGQVKREKNEPFRSLLKGIKRQMLHAQNLSFFHPVFEKRMEFAADPPEDFVQLTERLRV